MAIHPTAIIAPGAEIHPDAEIGPYCIVGPDCVVGARTVLHPHVHLVRCTRLGEDNVIHTGAVLGGDAQDRKYDGRPTWLIIGDRNHIREYSTIHRGTGDGGETRIGDDNLLMAYFHMGHDGRLGSRCTIANSVGISGHCVIDDDVNIGGMVGIHQFVRIGRRAMVGGFSRITQDVPPYLLVNGVPAEVVGLNIVGMRRAGMDQETRTLIKRAYKLVYRSNLNLSQALERIRKEVEQRPEVEYFVNFLQQVQEGYAGRGFDPHGKRSDSGH